MKKIIIRSIPFFAAVALLCVSVLIQAPSDTQPAVPQQSSAVSQSASPAEENTVQTGGSSEEMRAVWVPFMSLDMGKTDRSEKAVRDRIDTIMKNCRKAGANTVIFHVRPFSDALYRSELFPSSHIITGKQGEELSCDPLAIAVERAKKYGLRLHAWINPLRIKYSQSPPELSSGNPYMKWKTNSDPDDDRYTFTVNGNIYYAPSYPAVRKLITDGVRELVRNYDIDGVQIDDYFYPDEDGGHDDPEYEDYKKKAGQGCLTKSQWRKENINMLVAGIYDAVHSRSGCVFGISPQGNTDNDLKMGADVFLWCSQRGYADYICPQLYVSESHPTLPFRKAAQKWKDMIKIKGLRLYFGIALYKIGTDEDSGTWLRKSDNIRSQAGFIRSIGADGYMLFSYENLSDPNVQKEIAALKSTYQ